MVSPRSVTFLRFFAESDFGARKKNKKIGGKFIRWTPYYIPPNDTMGVDARRQAWEACPADCIPLVMGDLNINFEHPRNAREEAIADLLDEINLVDTSCKFWLR